LQEGESIVNLAYYNLIMSNDDVIQTLIDWFKNAQNMLTMLNMKGNPIAWGHDHHSSTSHGRWNKMILSI
jgi:hypothetical protein